MKMKKSLFLALSALIAAGSASFGQQVQTCSQAATYGLQNCVGPGAGRCKQTMEENRVNCLKTGTWERRTATGAKAGPDVPNLRKE